MARAAWIAVASWMVVTCTGLVLAQEGERAAPASGLFSPTDMALTPGGLFSHSDLAGRPRTDETGNDFRLMTMHPRALSLALPATTSVFGESEGGRFSYMTVKAGPLWYLDDLEPLDVGVTAEVLLGMKPLPFLAIEIGAGYLWGEDTGSDPEVELWGIPVMANAKLCIPVLFLEPYAGLGANGYYLNAKVTSSTTGSKRNESFVFGWSAFVGLNFRLGPVILGAEGKYFMTQEFAFPGPDPHLEAVAAMVTVGLDF